MEIATSSSSLLSSATPEYDSQRIIIEELLHASLPVLYGDHYTPADIEFLVRIMPARLQHDLIIKCGARLCVDNLLPLAYSDRDLQAAREILRHVFSTLSTVNGEETAACEQAAKWAAATLTEIPPHMRWVRMVGKDVLDAALEFNRELIEAWNDEFFDDGDQLRWHREQQRARTIQDEAARRKLLAQRVFSNLDAASRQFFMDKLQMPRWRNIFARWSDPLSLEQFRSGSYDAVFAPIMDVLQHTSLNITELCLLFGFDDVQHQQRAGGLPTRLWDMGYSLLVHLEWPADQKHKVSLATFRSLFPTMEWHRDIVVPHADRGMNVYSMFSRIDNRWFSLEDVLLLGVTNAKTLIKSMTDWKEFVDITYRARPIAIVEEQITTEVAAELQQNQTGAGLPVLVKQRYLSQCEAWIDVLRLRADHLFGHAVFGFERNPQSKHTREVDLRRRLQAPPLSWPPEDVKKLLAAGTDRKQQPRTQKR